MAPKTWGDLLSEVRRAIATEDWERGEHAVLYLQREAEHQADPDSLASAAFYAGMFHDARGELARAEASFAEAVSWDERAHGAVHEAVADALRSVAIVQAKRGHLEKATATRRRVAEVFTALDRPVLAAESLIQAGETLERAGYHKSAFDIVAEGIAMLVGQGEAAARTQRIYGYLIQSECLRKSGVLEGACDRAILATTLGRLPTDQALRRAAAVAWERLGHLAWQAWKDDGLSVLALAIARDLTPDRSFGEGLSETIALSSHAALAAAPMEGYVVSRTLRDGTVQLVHPHEGLVYARDERAAKLPLKRGDRVHAEMEDRSAAIGYRLTD